MLTNISSAKIDRLTKQRNILCLLTILLALAIVILSASLFFKDQTTILIPSEVTDSYKITGDKFSKSYLIDRSNEVIKNILNITPANLEIMQDTVLRMVHPSSYFVVKKELEKISIQTKSRKTTTVFFPIITKVNTKNLTAQIVGDLHTNLGKINKQERKVFELKFKDTGAKLALFEFKEVKNDN